MLVGNPVAGIGGVAHALIDGLGPYRADGDIGERNSNGGFDHGDFSLLVMNRTPVHCCQPVKTQPKFPYFLRIVPADKAQQSLVLAKKSEQGVMPEVIATRANSKPAHRLR